MKLEYMYITNRPDVARICEDMGVERVFVDMEWMGKAERQGHLDSVKSFHTLQDVANVRRVLTHSKLLVRVNPIHCETEAEVTGAIEAGADIVMLPMARTIDDAQRFIAAVNGRAKTVLLLETRDAARNIEGIINTGFDEVHIGLNDLSLEYGLPFMFSLLANGTVEDLCSRIRQQGIPYGFGGLARIGSGKLPTEYVLMEHIRLGSSRAILSRSFCNVDKMPDIATIKEVFATELPKLRNTEAVFHSASAEDFQKNIDNIRKLCA